MRILDIRALIGANYYFNEPIILMTVDLEAWAKLDSSKIDGFTPALTELISSLDEHHCSTGEKGGFITRLKEGTGFAHVIEHTAIELQNMAGMSIFDGKTRQFGPPSTYHIAYKYIDDEAGIYAGNKAFSIVEYLLYNLLSSLPEGIERRDVTKPDIDKIIKELIEIRDRNILGPSTQAIADEAKRCGIPVIRLDKHSLVQLGLGKYAKRIQATATERTCAIAVDIASRPSLVQSLLKDAGLPIVDTRIVDGIDEALLEAKSLGFPLTIKPFVGERGKGISLNISDEDDLKASFYRAKSFAEEVSIENFVQGQTYRFLVVNEKTIAVSRRTPASIIGDGIHTISELVEINNLARRSSDKKGIKVLLDEESDYLLKRLGLRTDTVLPSGQRINLQASCSSSLGGYSIDVTKMVHPENAYLAERAVRIVGLDIAGVDIIAPSIKESILKNDGKILAITTAPDFRPHISPAEGLGRNVATSVVDMLFPEGTPAWIPLIAITGTLGKTSVAHMVSHILQGLGENVGLASSEGLYVGHFKIKDSDYTGPEGAITLLKDPEVGCAVLEISSEGLQHRGLGYSMADIGVILNLDDEPLDDYPDRTLYLKEIVIRQVEEWGIIVANADDNRVVNMLKGINNPIIYFSLNTNNETIEKHLSNDGIAFIQDRGEIVFRQGEGIVTSVARLYELPFTHSGKADWQISNALAAAATVYALGLIADKKYKLKLRRGYTPSDLHYGLVSFYPTIDELPARLSYLRIGNLDFFLDKGCSDTSLLNLIRFTYRQYIKPKRLLVPCTLSVRDQYVENIINDLRDCFDEIVIYGQGALATLLLSKGIKHIHLRSEEESLGYVCQKMLSEGLVIYITSDAKRSKDLLLGLKEGVES